jgi:membrane protease YdiL (CAAX protease family)
MLGLAPMANDLGVRFAEAIHQSPENTVWLSQLVQNATRREFAVLALMLTVVPALVEEVLFRGVLLGALYGAPPWLALVLQALAFGAFHVDPAQSVATFILGLGFGVARQRTGTLTASVVSHATYNGIVLASMRFTVHDATDPSAHQGVGLLLGGVVLTALGMLGLLRFTRRPQE